MTTEDIKKQADKNYPKNLKLDNQDLIGLKGLTIKNDRRLWWDERPKFILQLSIVNSKHDIALFVETIPNDFQVTFFDNFHNVGPDPGAVVMFQKQNEDFLYCIGNHGWATNWDYISKSDLIDYIYKNREFNDDKIEIYRRTQKVELGHNLFDNKIIKTATNTRYKT